MEILEELTEIEAKFLAILNRNFKGIFVPSYGSSGYRFRLDLPQENSRYKETRYFYNLTENTKLIHFTKLTNLFSILSEKAIRLYSLTNANDETEYAHTAKILDFSDYRVNMVKKQSFTFSFCEYSELSDLNLWEEYADASKGCCIIFKIINQPEPWINYHLSPVHYEDVSNFIKYQNEILALKEEYPGSEFEPNLERLMIFHKTEKWKKEKEIRLASYLGDFSGHEDRKNKDIGTEIRDINNPNQYPRYVEYIKLPLAINRKESIMEYPQIIIESIAIGNNVPFNFYDKGKLRLEILKLVNEKVRRSEGEIIKVDFI